MSVVDGLRELEAAATPGPWARDGSEYSHGIRGRPPEGDIVASWDNRRDGRDDANIDFIAAMRNALPALLDVVAAAEASLGLSDDVQAYNRKQQRLRQALAALESAQGAEKQQAPLAQQRPETGAGS